MTDKVTDAQLALAVNELKNTGAFKVLQKWLEQEHEKNIDRALFATSSADVLRGRAQMTAEVNKALSLPMPRR